MKIYQILTIDDARQCLEYFNYFHDGFIKLITIISQDEFESDKSQLCTGLFDIELLFAHYNYADGKPPYNQRIKGSFHEVKDIHIDLRTVSMDWAINTFMIERAERSTLLGGFESCFIGKLRRNTLSAENIWIPTEVQLFTFSKAIFVEET